MQPETAAGVLLVDRDPKVSESIIGSLAPPKFDVEWVDDDEKAYNCLRSRSFDILLTELNIERIDGMRLMAAAKDRNPDICVIMIAQDPDIELATEAMRQGAYDFQTKPLNLGKLHAVIERGLSYQRLLHEQHRLRRRLDEAFGLTALVGQSKAFAAAYDTIRQAAPTEIPLILVGEPGTGKGFAAQVIHHNSPRADNAFVTMSCTADAAPLAERELLGHAPNAYSGATDPRPGRLELADQGTLFLDEARGLPRLLFEQVLNTLETGKTQRIGDDRVISANIRLVISVTPDLAADDPTRDFLIELQSRFDAMIIELPPLHERRDDIPLLTERFLQEATQEIGIPAPAITGNALDLLMRHTWPENVRQLRNTIQAIVIGAAPGRPVDVLDIPSAIRNHTVPSSEEIRIPRGASMQEAQRILIEEALKTHGYKKEDTAKALGIGLRTLYRKLKEYDAD